MFDIGFSELLLIAVVALVVIGPERLPKVARTAGLLMGRLQRYVGSVRADIQRELQFEELRRAGQAAQDSLREAAQTTQAHVSSVQQAVVEPAGKPLAVSYQIHEEGIVPAPQAVPSTAATLSLVPEPTSLPESDMSPQGELTFEPANTAKPTEQPPA